MTVKIKEFVQREWKRPGIDLFDRAGDFYSLSNLLPDPANPGRLKRAPSWSDPVSWPSGFTYASGAFYDDGEDVRAFVGTGDDSGDALRLVYYSNAWSPSTPNTLVAHATTERLGGLTRRNVAYFGGCLYVITAEGDVYENSDYTVPLSPIYSGSNARVLGSYGDRLYLATTQGHIYRLNDGAGAFESFYDPVVDLDVRLLAPFRHYLLVVVAGDDGTLGLYRLPDISPTTLHTLAVLPGDGKLPTPTYTASTGAMFIIHNDKLYVSLGKYRDQATGEYENQIYAFNGSWVAHVGYATGQGPAGLIHWKGHLLLHQYDTDKHYFQVLVGDHFTDFMELDVPNTPQAPAMSIGAELVVQNNNSGTRTFYRAGAAGYADGHLVTSRLDFAHPGKVKRLERLTAILDGAADGFKCIVKYRTDDTAAWTTALTQNNSRRASVGDLGITFYTLQLRIELDDDTGNNEDIGLQGLSVIYTVDD